MFTKDDVGHRIIIDVSADAKNREALAAYRTQLRIYEVQLAAHLGDPDNVAEPVPPAEPALAQKQRVVELSEVERDAIAAEWNAEAEAALQRAAAAEAAAKHQAAITAVERETAEKKLQTELDKLAIDPNDPTVSQEIKDYAASLGSEKK